MKRTKTLFYLLMMIFCVTFTSCEKDVINETIDQQIDVETALMNFENAMKTTNAPEYRTSKSELKPVYKVKRQTLLLEASKKLLLANGTTVKGLNEMEKNGSIIQQAIKIHFEETRGKLTL